MITLTPLAVPNGINALSAALDLASLAMTSDLAVQLSSTATGSDTMAVYGSNLAAVTTLAQLALLGNIGGSAGSVTNAGSNPSPASPGFQGGQAPYIFGPPQYRYLYVLRLSGATAGLTLLVTGQETPGTAASVVSVGVTAPIVNTGTASAPVIAIPAPWNVRNVVFGNSPVTAAAWDWVRCDTTAGNISVTGPNATGATWGAKKISADGNHVTVAASAGNIDGAATQQISVQWASLTIVGNGVGADIQA
jgi:hypothetical protein